jgi:ATP-dependent DNA helicase RecG
MNYIQTNLYAALKVCEIYFRNNTKWKVEFNDGSRPGFNREEIPEVPFKAIREALLNSFIHRDMLSPIANEFCIFKDRIEVFNPGEFNNEYQIEDYLNGGGKSICRNKLLSSTIYLSEDIESFGTGLKKINDLCKEADVKVEFIKDHVGFCVIFRRKDVEIEYVRKFDFKSLSNQEKKIILYLEKYGSITRKDVEQLLDIKGRRANDILTSLLKAKVIEFIGNSRESNYILK